MIKLNTGQLRLMYVACDLRSRFLQNIFLNVIFAKKKKKKKKMTHASPETLILIYFNNTQTISKEVPDLHTVFFSMVAQYCHHT